VQDAGLPLPLLREAYLDIIHIIWRLYRVCKLVHGDLSEYNLLYHNRAVYVIDVSQSVDLDHPKALDFLREDCKHVNDFFKKAGVPSLTMRELFDLVTDPLVTEENLDAVLETLKEVCTMVAHYSSSPQQDLVCQDNLVGQQ
jgi:RIO kinase 1